MRVAASGGGTFLSSSLAGAGMLLTPVALLLGAPKMDMLE
jgi:hypothetical protein